MKVRGALVLSAASIYAISFSLQQPKVVEQDAAPAGPQEKGASDTGLPVLKQKRAFPETAAALYSWEMVLTT